MLHRAQRCGNPLIVFSMLLTLFVAVAPPARSAPSRSSAGIATSPSALSVSVPLGQTTSTTITVTNSSNTPVTPAIYEAYPNGAPALATRQVAPELRAVALPKQATRLDPDVFAALQASPDQNADFLIYMRDQADLSAAYQLHDWDARGRYVFQTLVSHAARSQRALRGQLTARGLAYRPLWIVNAVLVHGQEADARELAERADVAFIRANHIAALPPLQPSVRGTEQCSPDQPSNPICWNLRRLGADRVWQTFGVTGQGIVVANIDTGVQYDHPALIARYRGYRGLAHYDHNYNWFTAQGIIQAPQDKVAHGTHTMGTMVGAGNGTLDQPSIGVAPGARWIAAQACSLFACAEADLIAAAQWMLAPADLAGQSPRPDLRPMIVNNSWAGRGGDSFYSGYVTAWRAAGIFPVFANGNTGSDCGSVNSPGDYANVVGVGATNSNDEIASFSARGPSADGRRKPDFVAPGQNILSAVPNASYQMLQGTSMATPHVAGAVALLWSSNPALIGDYDTTYAILRATARGLSDTQCGDPVGAANNVYGNGRINVYAAVARARVDVPWLSASALPRQIAAGGAARFDLRLDASKVTGPGVYKARLQLFGADLGQTPATITITLTVLAVAEQGVVRGRVVSADTGAAVAASVGVKGGMSVPTDSDGNYLLTLAPGSYALIATAASFLPKQLAIDVNSNQRAPDIVMQPDQAHITTTATTITRSVGLGQRPQITIPIGNSGTQPLYYHVRVLADKFATFRSDEPGGPRYRWIALPPGAPKLILHDNSYQDKVPMRIAFPFYSYTFTETLVASNGTLAFTAPSPPYGAPSSACLPDSDIFFYEIAPFRADLDPSRGGTIRYGTVDGGDTFVLSYENIPLHMGPADQTYTFQVLLHPDGRIIFQYQKLAALPRALAAGVQRTFRDYQELGCGADMPIHDGLAIELQPQTAADLWLHPGRTDGALPPASQHTIVATLDWVRPEVEPMQGQIEITSNDPIRARVVTRVRATMRRASHETLFPIMAHR